MSGGTPTTRSRPAVHRHHVLLCCLDACSVLFAAELPLFAPVLPTDLRDATDAFRREEKAAKAAAKAAKKAAKAAAQATKPAPKQERAAGKRRQREDDSAASGSRATKRRARLPRQAKHG